MRKPTDNIRGLSAFGIPRIPVTYSGGLVFCHTKAPIKNIVALAKRLGDRAKVTGKAANNLAYEVLESLDDVTSDFDEHRTKWLPKGLQSGKPDSQVFDASLLAKLLPALRAVQSLSDFPTRQLYRLCKLWREGEDFSDCVKRLKSEKLKEPVEAALAALGGSDIAWLHLLQMLPYIPEATK